MELSKELECWRAERPDEWKMEEFARQAKDLEQENAKLLSERAELISQKFHLKAQLSNTRLGLEKIDNLITHDGGMIEVDLVSGHLILSASGINSLQAPTLADLIDKIALMEVE
jgi:hypothetical protein